jgi:hypothetical protein
MAAVKKVKKGTYQMAAYNPRKKKAKKKVSKAARSRAAKKGARTRARKKVARSKAAKKGARTRARKTRRRRNPGEPVAKKVTAKKTNPKKTTAKKNPNSSTTTVAGKSLTVYKNGSQHRWMLRDGRTIIAGGAAATRAEAQAAGTARAGGRVNPTRSKTAKATVATENPRKRRKKKTTKRKVRRRRNPVEAPSLSFFEEMVASEATENPRKRRRKKTTRRKVRRRRNPATAKASPVRKTARLNPGRIRALTKI